MLAGSILQRLYDAHTAEQGRPLNFGVYFKHTLVALCHALEDSILAGEYSPLMITAFQRGKWYLEEADRYGEIADRARQVVIMAAPDAGFAEHSTSQKSNVSLVSLNPTDSVSQEWHLIILSPDYTAMVLCQELTAEDYGASGIPQEDQERKFYGFWTFEPSLVQETAQLAIDHIGTYDPALHQALTAHLQDIITLTHQQDALCGLPTADHLGDVVSRVIDYLQTRQHDLLSNSAVYPVLNHQGLDRNLVSNELQAFLRIAQLIDQTDLTNPMAAAEVATLAEAMGQLLELPAWQLHRLRLAGLLHRIAFLQSLETELISGASSRYDDYATVPLTCPLVPGTQILRRMQRMKAIATILTHQTEWWNGSGQPAGLVGDEIPVESRILGLVAAFQSELAARRQSADAHADESEVALSEALAACQALQGERWDPKLVDALTLLVSGLKQGLSLPVALPKIAAGLWLLDSHSNDELLEAIVNLTSIAPSTL